MEETKVLEALKSWIDKLQSYSDNDIKTNSPLLWERGNRNIYTYQRAVKWFKIWVETPQKSIFAFVNPENGDIYKASGINAPAKGVRANLFDEKLPMEAGQLYRVR